MINNVILRIKDYMQMHQTINAKQNKNDYEKIYVFFLNNGRFFFL